MKKHFLLLFTACIAASASYAQTPAITSFSPASGPVGTLVHITGTHLSSPTAFTIGGVSAIVVSDADTTLVGMVMPGAATGGVSVTTSGGTATASGHFTITPTPFPNTQQGNKLVGSGYVAPSGQNYVSLSADGNTAIVGGSEDDTATGAVWVFTRSGSIWTQQGPKLVGTGAVSVPSQVVGQGGIVALSADGNTFIETSGEDNSDTGAAWIFTRSGSVWTQQGPKLVGTGAIRASQQGTAAAISADGNTAVVGGYGDINSYGGGAIWVYTRSGGVWTQQGPKLMGTGAVGAAYQGTSVSISADGNTIIEGGWVDSNYTGAAWVFTCSGGVWTQQGPKLVGTGAINGTNGAQQGVSVSLSADGNTAMIGGKGDSSYAGAAWVFTRSGTTWTQQGPKLVGAGAVGAATQGYFVSLSADGNTAIVGGPEDNNQTGAFWIFTRSGNTWSQRGPKMVGTGAIGAAAQGLVSLSADGSTVIEGGGNDNREVGAAWVFASCLSSYDTIDRSICQGDTFTIGSKHYTASNTYIDTLTNVGGCDSIVTLHLTVNPLPVVTLTWDSLVQENDLYGLSQDTIWCNFFPYQFPMAGGWPSGGIYSGGYIENDSFQVPSFQLLSLTDTIAYTYTDSNQCTAMAIRYLKFDICEGIQEISGIDLVHLYPNPNTGTFTLTSDNSLLTTHTYTISDMLGQIIQQEAITSDNQLIDIGAAPIGIYMLSISGLSGSVKFAVLR